MRHAMVVLVALVAMFVLATPAAHAEPDPPPPAATCSVGIIPDWLCGNLAAAAPVATEVIAGTVPGVAAAPVVGAVVDFVTNPLGYLAAAVTGAAIWVMGQVMLLVNHATQPDLTAEFWVDAYTKGLAIGTLLLGCALLMEIVQVARRKASADELIETCSIWVPAWFAGALFGPALAQFLINGTGYLADGIIHSMTGYSGGDAIGSIASSAADAGIGGGATGAAQAFMALIVGIGVLVAAVAVFVSLCLQGVILYLSTAVFAIGWVWIVTQRHRETAWRIPRMFLGLVFGKALLFFLLGLCLAIATAATALQGDGPSRVFATAVMGTAGMLIAAFAPLILLRHAPIIPGTSTSRRVAETGAAAGGAGRRALRGGQLALKGGSKLGALAALRSGSSSSESAGGGSVLNRAMATATPYRRPGGGLGSSQPALGAGAPSNGPAQVSGRPGRPALTAGGHSRATQTKGGTPGPKGTPRTFEASTSAQGPVSSARRRIEQPMRRDIHTPPRRQTGGNNGSPSPTRLNGSPEPAPSSNGAAPVRQPRQLPDHEYVPPTEPPAEEQRV